MALDDNPSLARTCSYHLHSLPSNQRFSPLPSPHLGVRPLRPSAARPVPLTGRSPFSLLHATSTSSESIISGAPCQRVSLLWACDVRRVKHPLPQLRRRSMLNYVTKLSPLLTNPRFPCANVPRFPSTLISNDTLASPQGSRLDGKQIRRLR